MKKILIVTLLTIFFLIPLAAKGNGDGTSSPTNTINPLNNNPTFTTIQKYKPEDTINSINTEKKTVNNDNKFTHQVRNQKGGINKVKSGKNISIEAQHICSEFGKGLRQNSYKEVEEKEKFQTIKDLVKDLVENNDEFLNNMDPEENELLKRQIKTIQKAQNNIMNTLNDIDEEFSKEKTSREKLSTMNKNLIKGINQLERQYRAIEWILSED